MTSPFQKAELVFYLISLGLAARHHICRQGKLFLAATIYRAGSYDFFKSLMLSEAGLAEPVGRMNATDIEKSSELHEFLKLVKYNHASGTLICVPCKAARTSLASVKAHATQRHKFSVTIGKEFISAVVQKYEIPTPTSVLSKNQAKAALPRCLDGKSLTAPQLLYWEAPASLKLKSNTLPEIQDLDVFHGFQCPEENCLYCCLALETIRVHRIRDHKVKATNESSHGGNRDINSVYLQRIGNGTTCPYFPVSVNEIDRIIAPRSSANKTSASLTSEPFSGRGGTTQEAGAKPAFSSKKHSGGGAPLSSPISLEAAPTEASKGDMLQGETSSRGIASLDVSVNAAYADVGAVWQAISHLHASTARRRGSHIVSEQSDVGDRKESQIFVTQCGFKKMLSHLGFMQTESVPTELCQLKTFSRGVSGSYYPIRSENSENGSQSTSAIPRDPEDYKNQKATVEDVLQSVFKTAGVEEGDIQRHICEYLVHAAFASRNCCDSLLKVVSTRGDQEIVVGRASGASGRGKAISKTYSAFQALRENASFERYAREIMKLVLFSIRTGILQAICEPEVNAKSEIYTDQYFIFPVIDEAQMNAIRRRCGALFKKLSAQVRSSALLYFASVSKTGHLKHRKEEINFNLHVLLRTILLTVVTNSIRTDNLFIRHFIAVHCIHCPERNPEIPRYKKASEMSPMLAALLYCASSVGVLDKYECDEEEGAFFGPDSAALSAEIFSDSFILDANNSVSLLRSLLGKAMGVIRNSVGNLRLSWCESHDYCAILDGHKECSLETVGAAIVALQSTLSNILERNLLKGHRVHQSFRARCERLEDHLSMSANGCNFMSLAANEKFCIESYLSFLSHLADDPKTATQFFKKGTRADPRKNDNKKLPVLDSLSVDDECVVQYLKDCDEAVELLLVLIHLSGGAPARATELELYQLRNSKDSMRNIFIQQGRVMLLSNYNKTVGLTGREKPICRYLDKNTSHILIKFLILVRPPQSALLEGKIGSAEAANNEQYLFTRSGVRIPLKRIRTIIPKWLSTKGISFLFSEWRQFQSFMIQNYVAQNSTEVLLQTAGTEDDGYCFLTNNRDSRHDGTGSMSAMIDQFGHSSDTAIRHYGRSKNTVPGMGGNMMGSFLEASRTWQKMVQIEEQTSPVIHEKDEMRFKEFRSQPSVQNRKRHLANMACDIPKLTEEDPTDPVALTFKRQRLRGGRNDSETGGILCEVKARAEYSMLSTYQPLTGRSTMTLAQNRHLHKELCSFLKDADANFTCQAQKDAVFEAHRNVDDLVVCLGTGRGKSFIFQLAAYMERSTGGQTIVIVPLVALLEDHIRRCRALGLAVSRWSEKDSTDHSILFLSVEHVGTTQFQKYLSDACTGGRRTRIIIEECHLSYTWSDFRPAMLQLGTNLHHPSIPIQRILLSATIPPSLTPEIARRHGLISGYRVIRENTTRSNLSYNVIRVETSQFDSRESRVMIRAAEAVKEEVRTTVDFSLRHSASVEKSGEGKFNRHQIMIYVPFRNMVHSFEKILNKTLQSESSGASAMGPIHSGNRNGRTVQVLHMKCKDIIVCVEMPMHYYSTMEVEEKAVVQNHWNASSENLHQALLKKKNPGGGGKGFVYVQIMIATSAFGTRIDSPFVRSVIHVGFCRSMLDYIQETGRAGRDGLDAKCILVYNNKFAWSFAGRIRTELQDSIREVNNGEIQAFETRDIALQREADVAFAHFLSWVECSEKCRRQSLSEYIDGESCPECLIDCSRGMCDCCCDIREDKKRISLKVRPSSEPISPMSARVPTEDEGDKQPLEHHSGTASENQTKLNVRKMSSIEKLAASLDHIEKLRGMCVLCFAGGKEAHQENNECIRRAKACFKCLREGCGAGSCPTLASLGSSPVVHRAAQRVNRSLAGFRANIPKSTKNKPDACAQNIGKTHCWYCHIPLRFQGMRTHKPEDFGWKACLIRKAVQLTLVLWREKQIRLDLIKSFSLSETWDSDDAGVETQLVQWLAELNDEQDALNIMLVADVILG